MNRNLWIISKSKILMNIVIVLLFAISCVNLPYLPGYANFKYLSMVIIALCLLKRVPLFVSRDFVRLNILMIFFCVITIVSAIVNSMNNYSRNIVLASIVFSVILIETLTTMEWLATTAKITDAVHILFVLTIITVIFTDIFAIFFPNIFGKEGIAVRYLVGTKFNVVYLHLQMVVLHLVKNWYNYRQSFFSRIGLLVCIVLSILMSMYIGCNTGLIGSILLLVILIIGCKRYRLLSSPAILITVLLVSCSFAVFYEVVLNNGMVQTFITNKLGRTLTLTGRTNIYEVLPVIIMRHPLLGYGYGSAYEVSMLSFGYANAQNGLAQWIINVGFIGTFLILCWIYSGIKVWNKRASSRRRFFPIVAFIYVYSVLASVEITIDYNFFFWIAFLVGVAFEKGKKNHLEMANGVGYEDKREFISK